MAPKVTSRRMKAVNSEINKKLENKFKQTDQKVVMMMHLLEQYKEVVKLKDNACV